MVLFILICKEQRKNKTFQILFFTSRFDGRWPVSPMVPLEQKFNGE